MTELERKLLATVERLENESRERDKELRSYLQEVEKRLAELTDQYNAVLNVLEKLR